MEQLQAGTLNAQYVSREIALDLIDEPDTPERETMDPVALGELALNIGEVGLIKPLIVKPNGVRFETVAGHRRLLACRAAKYSPVPCRVMESEHINPLAVLLAENIHVERVNVVEEARFLQKLLTELCQDDCDKLCTMVRRRREYVEGRLLLLQGYPDVVAALEQGKIKINVAIQLNMVRDPKLLVLFLDSAIRQGATGATVEQWRRDSDGAPLMVLNTTGPAGETGDGLVPIVPFEMTCLFCGSPNHAHMMRVVYLHAPCKDVVEGILNARMAGGDEVTQ